MRWIVLVRVSAVVLAAHAVACGDDAQAEKAGPSAGTPEAGADDGGHGATVSGNLALQRCTAFGYFACCAWGCDLSVHVHKSPGDDCPRGIPGLDLANEYPSNYGYAWNDCFIKATEFYVVDPFEGWSPSSGDYCGVLTAEKCEAVVACVRAKGGVNALETMGYPSPGAAECPVSPIAPDSDAGRDDAGG